MLRELRYEPDQAVSPAWFVSLCDYSVTAGLILGDRMCGFSSSIEAILGSMS